MPSHSVSCQPLQRLRSRDVWRVVAAALLLTAAGCRDMREDTNYCKSCATDAPESSDNGVSVGTQDSSTSSAGPSMSQASGVSTGSQPMTSQQAGRSGAGATPSNGSSAAGASAAGSRASGGMRDAGASSAGHSGEGGRGASSGEAGKGSAANGGSDAPADAGMSQEPDAGHMQPLPCNGLCPPERPICDESTPTAQCVQCTRDDNHVCVNDTATCDVESNKCVECTLDDARNCSGDTHVCNRNNHCVVCTADRFESCPAAQPVCEDEKRCVECMPGNVDHCPLDRSMCSSDGHCIECTDNTQCTDPTRARCDRQTNSCGGCEDNNDCRDHFPGTPYCEKNSRTCFACTTDGEPMCGLGNFCNVNTHSCVAGSPTQNNCVPCKKDPECGASTEIAACLGTDSERFCFAAAVGGTCPSGYTVQSVPEHPSTSYCLPSNPSLCPAINNAVARKTCANKDECGKNGVCTPDKVCSLQCNNGPQTCPAPLTCDLLAGTCSKP